MIRRAFADDLPELAAWFGIRPADLDDMYPDEAARFLARVRYRKQNPAR